MWDGVWTIQEISCIGSKIRHAFNTDENCLQVFIRLFYLKDQPSIIIIKNRFRYNFFLNFLNMIVIILICVCGILLSIYPFILYFIFNQPLELPLPLLLIEIDHKTIVGYIITYLYQIYALVVFMCAICLVQPLNIIYTGYVTCIIEILRSNVKEFERIVLINDRNLCKEQRIKAAFKKLIDEHNEIIDVAADAEEILSCKCCLYSISRTILNFLFTLQFNYFLISLYSQYWFVLLCSTPESVDGIRVMRWPVSLCLSDFWIISLENSRQFKWKIFFSTFITSRGIAWVFRCKNLGWCSCKSHKRLNCLHVLAWNPLESIPFLR